MADPTENTDQVTTPGVEAPPKNTGLTFSPEYDEADCDRAIDQLAAAMDPENPSYETIPQELITSMPPYVWNELFYVPLRRHPAPIAKELGKLVGHLQDTRKITIRMDGPDSDPDWIETETQDSVRSSIQNLL